MRTSVKRADASVEHLPNTSLERYHYSNQLDRIVSNGGY
jgi:hypothetical protein